MCVEGTSYSDSPIITMLSHCILINQRDNPSSNYFSYVYVAGEEIDNDYFAPKPHKPRQVKPKELGMESGESN